MHELAEELAILVAAVEPPELTKHVADCLAQLEILAACDCCTRDAQHAFQLGQALLEVCNQQLGDTRRAIVA